MLKASSGAVILINDVGISTVNGKVATSNMYGATRHAREWPGL